MIRWVSMGIFHLGIAAVLAVAAPPAAGGDGAAADPGPRLGFNRIGLTLPPRPSPGKIPVVFVHGLWLGPNTWGPMIRALESDPEVSATHQFWTFGYASGDPIPYSAHRLRTALEEARRRVDPDRVDPAFDRMVVVGHSMGGLLAKLMVVDSGDRLWRLVSDRDATGLAGEEDDVAAVRDAMVFRARPDVRTAVFLATPHRGSTADRGVIHGVGTRLAARPGPFLLSYRRLIAANAPEFFKDPFRLRPITSIDELRWDSPVLKEILALRPSEDVAMHSIIPIRNGPNGPGGDDGVVAYASSHLDGVDSETFIPAGHLCQDAPAAIAEVRRILRGTAARRPEGPFSTCDPAPTSVEPERKSREVGLIFGEDRPDNRLY